MVCGNTFNALKPFTRSKISMLSCESVFESTWYCDESPFELTRLIIPIVTDENYLFQIDGMKLFPIRVGKVYHFDTRLYHRLLYNGESDINRIVIALGILPENNNPIKTLKNKVWLY